MVSPLRSFAGQTILMLGPHPDDEVFGCGGLIHRAKREGGKVYVLYMTVGTTQDFSKSGISTGEERRAEVEQVAKHLGFDGFRIAFPGNDYHLKLDNLPQKDLIHEIERGDQISIEALKPSIIIAPPTCDYNQDHRAVSEAAVTATRPVHPSFKHMVPVVLGYELPYNSWTSDYTTASPQLFVSLTKEDLDAKVHALKLYTSQQKDMEGPLSAKGMQTMSSLRGSCCGAEDAEAFIIKRMLV